MSSSGVSPARPLLTLADFTNEALMFPLLRERDVPGIIKVLANALQQANCIPELLPFYNEVLNREFLVSTAMTDGIALPHARISGLDQPWFALGRAAEPVVWGSNGAARVNFIFLVAVPATDAATYLRLLSALARLSKDRELSSELLNAPSPNKMIDTLARVPLRNASVT